MSAFHDNALIGASGSQGYQISRSVRLRSSASAYFSKTFTTPTDNKKWTWSGWVKRGKLGTAQTILGGSSSGTGQFPLYFTANDQLAFYDSDGVSTYYQIGTTSVFRDPSAWYHIVAVFDSANATQANRLIIYVNNVSQTLSSIGGSPGGLLPLNRQSYFNASGAANNIGCFYNASAVNNPLDGYIAESFFIDGQALTPSSFGETDTITGVWKPKKYAGTYGTNGFYLNFSDNSAATAAALGKDSSGNGNNWTPNNISVTAGVTYDSMTDVPTLNSPTAASYCVLNPLNNNNTLSNANLKAVTGTNTNSVGTIAVSSGKWYYEATFTTAGGSYPFVGFAPATSNFIGSTTSFVSGTSVWAGNGGFANGDVAGLALDLDGLTWTVYKNGVNITGGSYTSGAPSAGVTWVPAVSGVSSTLDVNFGQRPFAYTPPTGFKALNTFNLPDSTIKKGNQWFDVSLYTGNGGSQTVTNAGGFQPDFFWNKERGGINQHNLVDSVRGTANRLRTDATNAEEATPGTFTFNSNGFTTNTTNVSFNGSGQTYVAWQWKKGATPGFDIVTYTGTGVARTVAHSLGVAPRMMIVKNRNSGAGYNWRVYHGSLASAANYLEINTTAASQSDTTVWNNTAPTSSVFSLGTSANVNANADTYVAYLFAEVAGFSKFGSYTGNGSADGSFVYCGFRPRYVLAKRTDVADSWQVYDTARDTFNTTAANLYPNLSNAEVTDNTTQNIDILSNGFKLRNTNARLNASGGTYIFAAFAENPFKYALAR